MLVEIGGIPRFVESSSVRTNLIARVSRIQGHEIRVVLYAHLDSSNYRFY